jgi:multidrug efflux pump
MSRFFIDRPIFAWVIAIAIMLAGALAIRILPVAQYPRIALPAITVTATYPGASAKTLEDTVTQVIEQQMKGIDNLKYMSATSSATGAAEIIVTFEAGTDPDIAQVQVQNKLQLATPLLPAEVQRQGLTVTKSQINFVMVASVVSTDDRLTQDDAGDYAATNLRDQIARVPGVGEVQLFGAQYAMRIWLDPNKLINFGLTPLDVSDAIEAQNAQVSAGQLGGAPSVGGQELNATINAQTRLQTADEFRNIILRTNTDGSMVRLGDVARVELGSESYDMVTRYNGRPVASLAIRLATGANALETAEAVKARLSELSQFFPAGMSVVYPYDTVPFVKLSIEEVVKTLAEAIALVFLVMYLFLQSFRATLIPTIAVPVVLLGTFGVLAAFGFSINTLTMFGMVLAIGLLVDDAIVVVENVERVMREEGLRPREATRKSMDQITGALVGIAMVLSAVFVPMAFFGGSTGAIYRQFSVTIVSAMALSVLVALILTPALCATLLKPGHHVATRGFFGWFNRWFDRGAAGYQSAVGGILGRGKRFVAIYLAIGAVMAFLFMRLPTGFLPEEDQGFLFALVQLPAGGTQERTAAVLDKVSKHFLEDQKEAVASVLTIAGFGFAGNGQNTGLAFISLKPWDERNRPDLRAPAVVAKAMAKFSTIREALAFAFTPPAVLEIGNVSGFDLELQDRGGLGHEALMAARNQLLAEATKDPALMAVRPQGQEDTPQFQIDIDLAKSGAFGLSVSDINRTLSAAWGGSYVDDFIDRGRVKKVYVQADAPFRMAPEDLDRWYVRNNKGQMVPFSAFSTAHWTYGSPRLERYNGIAAVEIVGQNAPGHSSGEAMDAIERIAAKLPAGIGFEWTGISLQERLSGSQAPALYAISLLVVFLCLAALYESWSIPAAVMLVVPIGIVGALAAATFRGFANDIYFQIGLLTTAGLSAKNAILIVEFAKELHEKGKDVGAAAIEAARMRLRPILMTSLAFVLGVLPLAISTGAGSGGQNAIGTGVVGGTLSATALGIFFVPMFFVIIRRLFPGHRREVAAASVPAE